ARAVPGPLFPRQRRGSRPLLLVLQDHAGPLHGPRAGRGVPGVWYLRRHDRRGGHHGQRAGRHVLRDGGAEVAQRRHQALRAVDRHGPGGDAGDAVPRGRRGSGEPLHQHPGVVPPAGGAPRRLRRRPLQQRCEGLEDIELHADHPWTAG
ncbi:unnamed protein product, partial [Prorocentrum cordatum]